MLFNYTRRIITTPKEIAEITKHIIKAVVDCIAEKRYDCIENYVSFQENDSVELFREYMEGCLECNELSHIDKFGTPCNFFPNYKYHPISFYMYNSRKCFAVDYDLTTDGEINDFTLQMEFLFTDNGINAYILDVHIL